MGKIEVLAPEEIEALLRGALVGRIACCAPDQDGGRPYVVPLSYGYDGEAVYAHSGPGRKLRLMRAQPLVSFEVDTAEAPDRWSSAIAEGVYEELSDPAARAEALAIIYPTGVLPALGPETVVYRLRLTAKSGRREVPDDMAPGP